LRDTKLNGDVAIKAACIRQSVRRRLWHFAGKAKGGHKKGPTREQARPDASVTAGWGEKPDWENQAQTLEDPAKQARKHAITGL
jgi:hypothetical protein